MRRSSSTEAIVLKRTNVGEADRVVTLFTQDQGKLTAVAKGARKLSSSKRAFLEPGNHIKCLLISTSSMPLLTQATLVDDCQAAHQSLPKMRQLVQVLEIIDTVFVEEQIDEDTFEAVIELRNLVVKGTTPARIIRQKLEEMLMNLGYQNPKDSKYPTILEYVSAIADKPMKSWDYLKVKE
ncbi:MAG TPA: DNA repair protein RecO [Vitreimonas sp.]|nr:DNA repair protein RecO [Vitreimonas sp.]